RSVLGDKRAIDLGTGAVRPPLSSPLGRGRGGGANALSHDGRLIARWSLCRWVEAADASEGKRTPPPAAMPPDANFLEGIERASGKRLWRVPNEGCREWRFSPDDRFLEKEHNWAGAEIIDALTGERVEFPGGLLDIAPGGREVVLTATGPELWSV